MTLEDKIIKKIISSVIKNEDYRIHILASTNALFLQYVIDFFKKIVSAKLKNEKITKDWYKKEFLDPRLSKKEIAINSGLNQKTISNSFNTTRKEVVIDASNKHYDELYKSIEDLVINEDDLDVTLTIKFKKISVDLTVSESLIVINSLAVKRHAIKGGLWSTAGKKTEKKLMLTLCKLFNVSIENYALKKDNKEVRKNDFDFEREVDFYLKNKQKDQEYRCEVKLMGKGNPESADVIIARGSKVFIADKLSKTNIKQMDSLGVEWIELRRKDGYKRFKTILTRLDIPHQDFKGNLDKRIQEIFSEIF